MSETGKRELKHIVANFSLRKKASGYRMDSGSTTIYAIYDLFKQHLIKCIKVNGPYLYVVPTKYLLGFKF